MKIAVVKTDTQRFKLSLGAQTFELDEHDMRVLWAQIENAIRPEARDERDQRYKSFLALLIEATDSGIQNLLRTAAHEDILVLLYSSEQHDALKKKLYRNMSENSIKLFVEDLLFEFRDGVPGYRFDDAMTRLIGTVEKMAESGTIAFSRKPR